MEETTTDKPQTEYDQFVSQKETVLKEAGDMTTMERILLDLHMNAIYGARVAFEEKNRIFAGIFETIVKVTSFNGTMDLVSGKKVQMGTVNTPLSSMGTLQYCMPRILNSQLSV